jgi:hypothetical protein
MTAESSFVRIEFAGIAAEPGSEINGLTLGGVGSGTILENIQVSFGMMMHTNGLVGR